MDNSEGISVDIFLKPRVLKSKNKSPRMLIKINDTVLGEFDAVPDEVGILKVSYNLQVSEGPNELSIALTNKDSTQDTVVTDAGEILDDLNCEILGITCEGVELDNLIRLHGTYYLDEVVHFNNEDHKVIPSHTFLSWNGTYKFRFNSPLYVWLLENL
jgi:hypothetical protein